MSFLCYVSPKYFWRLPGTLFLYSSHHPIVLSINDKHTLPVKHANTSHCSPKNNSFTWTPVAAQAFQTLKMAMCTSPVLALPDFTKTFVLKCDASGKEIVVVLMQEGRPLAFTNKQLSEINLVKSIYEKEMLTILHAVDLWRPYLLGKHFQIKTDHQSLKYFLEQRISSREQQKWVTKLFGYDYEIIYKKGKDNVVVDALSQKYEDEGSLFSLSFIVPDWLQAVLQEWLQDPKNS
jgi:hypothetical protein